MDIRIKKICAVFVTGVLAVSVFACGSKAENSPIGIEQNETQKTDAEQEIREQNQTKGADETSEDMPKTEKETGTEVDSKVEKTEDDEAKDEAPTHKDKKSEEVENGKVTEKGFDPEAVKKVAEVTELLNDMMPGMMPEDVGQHATVSFSSEGTVVYMNLILVVNICAILVNLQKIVCCP